MSGAGPWPFVARDELEALHSHAIAKHGGEGSPPQPGCLDRSIGAAINAALYQSDLAEPDLLIAAAYLLVYLAKNHCFVDGNKRVAWMGIVRVLFLNGLAMDADEAEAAELVNNVATDVVDAVGVVRWLSVPGRLVAASHAMDSASD